MTAIIDRGPRRQQHFSMTYYVYTMTNRPRGTLYIGVTGDLIRRAWEHREGIVKGLTSRYNLTRLVYYDDFPWVHDAIDREKRLKHWNCAWKIALIEERNPNWDDLYATLM